MKTIALALLPLVLSASVPQNAGDKIQSRQPRGHLQPRQLDLLASIFNVTVPTARAVKTVEIKPLLRSTAKRAKISFGPYVIPGFDQPKPKDWLGQGLDPSGYTWYEIFDGLPRNATYLSAQIDMTYEDGTRADINSGVYLHHVVIFNMDKWASPMSFCFFGFPMPKMPGSEFIGASNDAGPWLFTTGDGSFNSGFHVGTKDRMAWYGEVINYKKEPKKLYVTLEAEYVEGRPQGMLDTQISLFNVQGCFAPVEIGIPNNRTVFNITSSKFPIPEDGYVVSIKGHLHDGGTHLEAFINDKLVCDSVATYGGTDATMYGESGNGKWETISYMSTCEKLVEVKKGDMVQIKAYYDGDKHKLRQNSHGQHQAEMGVLTMYFAPKNK